MTRRSLSVPVRTLERDEIPLFNITFVFTPGCLSLRAGRTTMSSNTFVCLTLLIVLQHWCWKKLMLIYQSVKNHLMSSRWEGSK